MLMDAIVIDEFGGAEKLHVEQLPIPTPKENQVLIHIAYTSVNPVDWKICEGMLKDVLPHQFPLVPGWDASGTIVQVGAVVNNFKDGDEVFAYCRKPIVQEGTYAEYIAVDAEAVALKPKKLTFAHAAALPLVALTAWQALVEHVHLQKGDTIFIAGGAGGVGSLAVELAKYFGAKVYTSASAANHAYVKGLGADVAIDYHQENVAQKIKSLEPNGIDVAFDCVGGKTLAECFAIVKPDGRLVTIAGRIDAARAEAEKIKASYCFVAPNGKQLAEIGRLIEQGQLQLPQIEEMPLSRFAEAQERSRQGHTRGKIVLKVDE